MALTKKEKSYIKSTKHRRLQESTARAWTDMWKLQVFFQKGKVATDCVRTIWLDPYRAMERFPKLPAKQIIAFVMGQNAHECAHLWYTDPRVFEKMEEYSKADPTIVLPALRYLANIIEDSAIELAAANNRDWPGTIRYINFANRILYQAAPTYEKRKETLSKLQLILSVILDLAVCGRIKGEITDSDVQELFDQALPIVVKGRRGKTSFERLDAAKELYELLRHLIDEEKDSFAPPTTIEKPDDSSAMRSGGSGKKPHAMPAIKSDPLKMSGPKADTADEEEEGKSEEPDSKPDEDKEEPGSKPSDDETEEEDPASDAGSDEDDLDMEIPEDEFDRLGEILDSYREEVEMPDTPPEYPPDIDCGPIHKGARIKVNPVYKKATSGAEMAYQTTLQVIQPLIRGFVNQLSAVIKRQQTDYVRGLDSGDLDADALYSVRTPEKFSVFCEEKRPGRRVNLSLQLLIDESGSMGCGDRIVVARTTAILIEAVCREIGIPISVLGHTAHGENVDINEYVPFNRPDAKTALAHIRAQLDNRDGMAIRWAGEYLFRNAPTPDRVLIVVSDGEPAHAFHSYGGSMACSDTRQQIAYVEAKLGIPVIGVGFSHDGLAIRTMYKHFVAAGNIETLPRKLTDLLKKLIA